MRSHRSQPELPSPPAPSSNVNTEAVTPGPERDGAEPATLQPALPMPDEAMCISAHYNGEVWMVCTREHGHEWPCVFVEGADAD